MLRAGFEAEEKQTGLASHSPTAQSADAAQRLTKTKPLLKRG